MTHRRAGRVVARLGVLMESANLLAVGDEPFGRTCARVVRELGSHLDAEATVRWAATAGSAMSGPSGGDAPASGPTPAGGPTTGDPTAVGGDAGRAHLAVAAITVGERVLGDLVVQRCDGPAFDADERRLVRDVAAQLASGWTLHELPGVACTTTVLQAGFDDSPIGVALIGGDGIVRRVNRAFCELLGTRPDRLEGRPWHEVLVGPAHGAAAIDLTLDDPDRPLGHHHGRHRYRRADGTTVRAHVVQTPVLPDGPDRPDTAVTLVQVLAVSAAEAEPLDELTGVATRQAVLQHLQDVLAVDEGRSDVGVAVGVVGLDHFSALNAAYGDPVGDEALRRVAGAVCGAVRPTDVVGRLGGDEFLVVFDAVGPARANELGGAVADALGGLTIPVDDGLQHALGASIGLAWAGRPTDDRRLLAEARRGLREAKRRGRGRLWQHRPTEGSGPDAFPPVTARDLQLAIDRREFTLLYQPIVTSAGHRLRGVEALLRWDHPTVGRLTPDRFLQELLESGQISAVGRWAVREAVDQLARWRSRPGGAGLVMNVNISLAELAQPAFASVLQAAIDEAGIDPGAVCVELTEQALDGTVVSPSGLRRIADTGVRLALDDLGTGVSTLSHLRLRPLHGIKIDRSFICGLDGGEADRSIVRGLVTMAHGLGLEVTAEGVETTEQAAWLASVGCHLLQGWRFSRAVEPAAIGRMVDLQPA